jgi:hypothetical protein
LSLFCSSCARSPRSEAHARTNASLIPLFAAANSEVAPYVVWNEMYWAAQPPAVRVLETLSGNEREVKAKQLAEQGYVIDWPIMGWGWSPWHVMNVRQQVYKLGSVPSALGSPAIKVSLDPADYPAYPDPNKPKPAGKDSPVGDAVGYGNRYYTTKFDNLVQYPDGAKWTDARGTFVKRVIVLQPNPFNPGGVSISWEKQP